MINRPQPVARSHFPEFIPLTTRWNDNDIYGHLNNVVYFELFDTAINSFLIEKKLIDIHHGETVGLVVENKCSYFSSVKFPDALDVGIKVSKIGKTSVTYEIGIFNAGTDLSSAVGTFVHVYVERATHKPAPLDEVFKAELLKLMM